MGLNNNIDWSQVCLMRQPNQLGFHILNKN